MLHKQLELEIDGSRVLNGVSLGSLSVSVVFRDVESVASTGTPVNNIILHFSQIFAQGGGQYKVVCVTVGSKIMLLWGQ